MSIGYELEGERSTGEQRRRFELTSNEPRHEQQYAHTQVLASSHYTTSKQPSPNPNPTHHPIIHTQAQGDTIESRRLEPQREKKKPEEGDENGAGWW